MVGGAAPGGTLPEEADTHAAFRAALLAFLDTDASRLCRLVLSADVSAPDHTMLHVIGVHPALWFKFRHDGAIDVGVDWDGRPWDFVAGFDVFPRRVSGGWVRSLSEYEPQDEMRDVRPSREEVWRRDGFEVVIRWLNAAIVPGAYVELSGRPDDMACACLVRDGEFLFGCRLLCVEGDGSRIIPLRTA